MEISLLALYAVMLPVIILFCGLSIDVGLIELKKLQMQTAADAGAIGAELEWERGTSDQGVRGQADAALNGFTNGVDNVTVDVTGPPPGGDYNNRYDAQYVPITQTVNTIFMGALHGGKTTVSASAVSLMPPCGYMMNTAGISNAYGLNITNTMSVPSQGLYPRCPVYINHGLYLASSMNLDGYALNATGTAGQSSVNNSEWPPATYGALTVTDPLAAVTQPTASACNHTNFSASASVTLSPGTYCGSSSTPGMTLSGSSTTISFNPGLYVITGGLHATTAVSLSGAGVTLFFTKGSGVPYGKIIFDGDTHVNLSAPSVSSGGALAYILFFTDRNWVHTSAQDFQFNDAVYYGSGIWYVTGTGIQMTDGSSTWSPGYLDVVADSIYIDSSTLNLFSDFSAINTGNPFRTRAVLVQ